MEDVERAIAAFWAWWRESGRARAVAGIEGAGVDDAFVEEIGGRLDAIASGLVWELAPGREAEHALVVGAGGDPELRAVAHRTIRAAPAAGDGFEYHAARQGDPESLRHEVRFEGVEIDLRLLTCAAELDEEREEVDVQIHHPAFASAHEGLRGQVAFLALDWLLGEEEVERWIGAIDTPDAEPPGARPFPELLEAVAAARRLGGDEPRGVLGEYEDERGRRVLVSAERPLKPVDFPLFDTHAAVRLAFAPAREDGWPEPEALEWLREREDELRAALGDEALLAAHETAGGARTFHLYFDGTAGTEGRLREHVRAALPDAEVAVERDPAWDAVRPFR